MPLQAFANEVEEVVKDSEEKLKIYRKTSVTPGEENKKFLYNMYSREPLGLEIMEGTEIEIVIDGEGVFGSGELMLHDVNAIQHVQTITVGKKTTVKVPRKGQLFLDVANIKYDSVDKYEDFSANVTINLSKEHYKVTPTFDIRKEKISNRAILDEGEFKKQMLSDSNKEDGTLLISDNIRIYIPKSKYIPKDTDATDTLDLHEETLAEFNKLAGLDVNNADQLNRPRENFSLVSAQNNQAGYMSAGGTMFSVRPESIHEYLDKKGSDKWGMYHEYGHNFEQGWGYGEYWNNIFANQLTRKKIGNENWAWIYGTNRAGYEMNNVKPNYDAYLKEGKITGNKVHPMYYFLSFIDFYDKDFMANIETYYRENSVPYGGSDYIIYYAAKQYGWNIIPYMEALGEVVSNKELIKDVVQSTNTSFIHIPKTKEFEKLNNISVPVTVSSLYAGKNRVIQGMSNKNAEIVITVDGIEHKVRTDVNGKFKFTFEEMITLDSVITVSSKEDGKIKSFDKKVQINDENARVSFKGYNNEEFMSLSLDSANKKLKAESTGKVANDYVLGEYITIEQYNKKGELKERFSLSGNQNADELTKKISEKKYNEGDYLKFSHKEQYQRLSISGYIENATFDLTDGVRNLELRNSYFYIINGNLVYSDSKLDLVENKDDLIDLIKVQNLKGEEYTKTTWKLYETNLLHAQMIVEKNDATQEEISVAYSMLHRSIENLRKINNIEFKGYNNDIFLSVGFDTENKRFIATSSGNVANRFSNGVYGKIIHFDKKGNVKGEYGVQASGTADAVAEALNTVTYTEGDYLKFYHKEQGRLFVKGHVENSPSDLSNGVGNLDLTKSLFYLTGENVRYSNEQLDLSSDKSVLVNKLEEVRHLSLETYTKSTFGKLTEAIRLGEALVQATNVTDEEIKTAVTTIETAVANLKAVNKIEFKGYNNDIFLSLGFDMEKKQFVATSNGKTVHPYQYSRDYAVLYHYDKKGNEKGKYIAKANKTADEMAKALNGTAFVEGDYLKISHLEQGNRLVVKGHLENSPSDLSNGVKNLDLTNSFFYLTGENLSYTTKQLDLSSDKTALVNKLEEVKKLSATAYTKTSFSVLTEAIKAGEALVQATNVTGEEVKTTVTTIETAVVGLKAVTIVEFKGYNNELFLTLGFDTEAKKFVATSTGKIANGFSNGVYGKITHFDKKGNVKGDYAVQANGTADVAAEALNKVTYTEGDYLKFYHKEQGNRLAVKGYVEKGLSDLSNGVGNLDLTNSLFYLTGENLSYSSKQLDLSSDKTALVNKLEEVKKLSATDYTKASFSKLTEAIKAGEVLVKATNVTDAEIKTAVTNLETAVANLKAINVIEFKGYNSETFLTLGFDTEKKQFAATTNGKMVHPYQYSRDYAILYHYDKKGNEKGKYVAKANQTADEMAKALNGVTFAEGDYLKMSHLEQGNRLVIKGHVENSPSDLSKGVGTLDLGTSFFYLKGENMTYSTTQLDLSDDKTSLVNKLKEVKALPSERYTKGSFGTLTEAIRAGEALVKATNVTTAEIKTAVKAIETAVANLKEVNVIEFKGYNNEIFLRVGFDMEKKKFIATSNGKMVHPYQNGRDYASMTHYDKDGTIKGTYTVKANGTADDVAKRLNEAIFVEGDFLTFAHIEQNSRLVVKGYVKNTPANLSNGVGSLNLQASKFTIIDENLTYETK